MGDVVSLSDYKLKKALEVLSDTQRQVFMVCYELAVESVQREMRRLAMSDAKKRIAQVITPHVKSES